MNIRLTLLDPARTGARVDVRVDATNGTALAAVHEPLRCALGGPDGAQFRCAGRVLDRSAPLGVPPLVHGAVLTLADGPAVAAPVDAALLELHVVAGPRAGDVVPLPTGRHRLGRDRDSCVPLADPDVSRTHAELVVGADGIELNDAGSTNGTRLNGELLIDGPVAVRPGDRIRVGGHTLMLQTPDRPPAGLTVDGEGHLRVNRAPRLQPQRPVAEIRFPAAPAERNAVRIPWPAMLLPLLLSVPMAFVWRQPALLLFALMSPLLMAGQVIADRRGGRRDAVRQWAGHERLTGRREQQLATAMALDATHLEQNRPDLARLAVTARVPTDDLWRRSTGDTDFACVRLGRGTEPARVTVYRSPAPGADEPAGPERPVHPDVPVGVDLPALRVLGACGPRSEVLALARSLIGQLAVLHSPRDLHIQLYTAEADRGRDWQWLAWLPHHEPAGSGSGADGAQHVVILDGAHALRRRTAVAAVLAMADAEGIDEIAFGAMVDAATNRPGASGPGPLLLCLDEGAADLPRECRATVTLTADAATAVLRRRGHEPALFAADLAGERWIEQVARSLAPLRDPTADPGGRLPDDVRLLDLLAGADLDAEGVRAVDPADLARHWRRDEPTAPLATLGATTDGILHIDLRRDGPHLLIGGTTGSGKSELLQTMVTSLAVHSPPDAVSFLLIDYKGGAAFGECAALPHVGGVITDLDPHLAQRALASLTAELRRRERLLGSAGAADVDTYHAARVADLGLAPMPRLVVVVDEFRVLAEELPDFVGGLVRTATVGRSLGVHLVLATQRPAGVVSAEIRANTNLRIALRVRDGGDSRDLIDDQAAARLPPAPGRGLLRTGSDPLIPFHTARVTGTTTAATDRPPTVHRLGPDGSEVLPASTARRLTAPPGGGLSLDSPPLSTASSPAGAPRAAAGDLPRIAEAATAAARLMGIESALPPWLPPLPDRLPIDRLIEQTAQARAAMSANAGIETHRRPFSTGVPRPAPDDSRCLRLPFGLIDLPAHQRQEVLTWDLGGPHLAVAGGPRSGRSTALRTLVEVARPEAAHGALHVYLIDAVGAAAGPGGAGPLPGVEAVVPVHDIERAERLLRLLRSEIDARRRELQPAPAAPVVLLVDGWEGLLSAWTEVRHGRMIDDLVSVLHDGPSAGVHAAISGGRSLLTGSISSLLAARVVLRFADPADAALAGIRIKTVGPQPAGRGWFIGPGRIEPAEVQVAQPSEPDPVAASAAGSVTGSAAGRSGDVRTRATPPGRSGWALPELPRRLTYQELIAAWPLRPQASLIPIGIGGDEAEPVGIEVADPVTLVLGPPGSGRSNALRLVAAGLRRGGRTVVTVSFSGRRTDGHPPPATTGPALPVAVDGTALPVAVDGTALPGAIDGTLAWAPRALAEGPVANPGVVVLVDELPRPGVADAVADLLVERSLRGHLVVATTPADVAGAYRGLPALARTARSGILLAGCGSGDGEVFGLGVESQVRGPAGRAVMVRPGQRVPVQLALLGSAAEGWAQPRTVAKET